MKGERWMFNGRPAGPDVEAIIKEVPVAGLAVGVVVSYARIAEIIHEGVGSNRFRTVTASWRKRLERNNNIVFGTIANEGFVVLDPPQRVEFSSSRLSGGLRKIRAGARVAAQTPENDLTEDEKRTRNYVLVVGGSVQQIMQSERKKLAYKVVSVSEGKANAAG